MTLNDLKKAFDNTRWLTPDKKFLNFYRGGNLLQNIRPAFGDYWAVEKPDVLKIWNANPAKNRKAPFLLFRIDLATKTARIDVASSTASGSEGLVLSYEGPAKAAKWSNTALLQRLRRPDARGFIRDGAAEPPAAEAEGELTGRRARRRG